ncbi:PAS domain S-box protein [Mucilaginibacter glaciei]|uniref:histidine kinase n=1 Tax=Mucilaginibacter glaciei TaxID=2772109 RepID=A0A926NQ48_9SPHI|nr:PAS domain S-box protein [Mucilaginibacter glaciei]MBD1393886.1 PAS domain S-box protein [Mucilaginibacter glaciei]
MEDIYKIILEETLAGYWDWDIKTDIMFLSPALKRMLGYEVDELIGGHAVLQSLILPDDLPVAKACFYDHVNSHGVKLYNIDIRFSQKNGEILCINCTGRVIEWDGNEPARMIGCHIDVTEKKKAEGDLAISEETFRNAFEFSPIGMVLVSIKGKFLKVNKSLCDMLGYTAKELLCKTFQEITHPDDLEADLTLLQKTLSGEISTYQMEKRYFKKDGGVLWILLNVSLIYDRSSRPHYFISQIKDITEPKNAEAALRETQRRWIFASEGSGGGIWDWDLANNTIFHSEQCIRMIGFEPHEFDNIPGVWTQKVHPDDKVKYLADIQEYLDGNTEIYTNQHRVLCRDGSYKWILDRGKVIEYAPDGTPARIIGTHTDITDQKQKEEQLRYTLDMVSGQNNRLLNFAYIVSHNLRTHASNFKMIMDVVKDPDTDAQEKEQLSMHLQSVSDQLNDTINNLNEVVSIQTNIDIQTYEINLFNYVTRAIDLLQGDISRWNVEVINEVPVDCKLVYNPAYMESIIFNLLSNALKYRCLHGKPKVMITYFTDTDGRQGFGVADNGIGIDLHKNGHDMFGMYKTFNGNRDAKGMGLFITKNQVESFGGRIEVASEIGKGTTFTVHLN